MAPRPETLHDALSAKLKTDELLLLCGEMSDREIRTAKAVLSWAIRQNQSFAVSRDGGLPVEAALQTAQKAITGVRRSFPDYVSSTALNAASEALTAAFAVPAHQIGT